MAFGESSEALPIADGETTKRHVEGYEKVVINFTLFEKYVPLRTQAECILITAE